MGKIIKMSPHLANMIAAGEVVEKPSSVVKELVENAIDAHAKCIKVYLTNGGIDEIKVVDDGDGMDSDDVAMAFLPHATSKIKTEYDLFRIQTLGFRGEAIASIAAVSKVQIISSTTGLEGYETTYKAGVKQSEGVFNSNKGTTVTVNGLFFNTPARFKYLKAAKNELASITFLLDRIAMAHPDLRFSVYHENKPVIETSASNDYQSLMGEIYGLDAARNVIIHEYSADGYTAKLVFVKPQIYRSNKLEITMICNGRYVKNYNVTNAVIEGFQTYLPIGKYPIGIMYFSIDPLLVDVNVHPNKIEIKISSEDALCQRLIVEIKNLLGTTNHIPTRTMTSNESYQKQSIFNEDTNLVLNEPTVNYIRTEAYVPPKTIVNNSPQKSEKEVIRDNTVNANLNDSKSIPDLGKKKIPYMEYVGTIFGTYLIFQNSDGMYMIDQHAAAERINYEKYYQILGDNRQPATELLVPVVVSFTKQEALYLEQNLEAFATIGFVLSQSGETDFVIRQVPLWAKFDDIEDIVYEIISLMIHNQQISIIYFRDKIAKQISCKASIKANHAISKNEIDYLINELNKCSNPFTCPHGRPTIIKLTVSDIEKMFERIQK